MDPSQESINHDEETTFSEIIKKYKGKITFEIADSWLKVLYGSYTNRFISDNNRIWVMATIFVPLSLAPFTALVVLTEKTLFNLFVLAFPSISLLLFWNIASDRHRSFQEKSLEKVSVIEDLIGIQKSSLYTSNIQTDKQNFSCVRLSRWIFLGVVSFIWFLIIYFSLSGCFKI